MFVCALFFWREAASFSLHPHSYCRVHGGGTSRERDRFFFFLLAGCCSVFDQLGSGHPPQLLFSPCTVFFFCCYSCGDACGCCRVPTTLIHRSFLFSMCCLMFFLSVSSSSSFVHLFYSLVCVHLKSERCHNCCTFLLLCLIALCYASSFRTPFPAPVCAFLFRSLLPDHRIPFFFVELFPKD
jgi:hypothetical protein